MVCASISPGRAIRPTAVPAITPGRARTEARRHFKTGMSLVEKKRFPEGIKELEKAYELLPHPNVAFNIAQAQAEAGNLDFAIRAYRT